MSDIPQDAVALPLCNESELLTLIRKQGLPRLKRGLSLQELLGVASGELQVLPHMISETEVTRGILEDFINKNWGKVQSQLPGCNGKCRTFECTEGKHALCLFPNKDLLR